MQLNVTNSSGQDLLVSQCTWVCACVPESVCMYVRVHVAFNYLHVLARANLFANRVTNIKMKKIACLFITSSSKKNEAW